MTARPRTADGSPCAPAAPLLSIRGLCGGTEGGAREILHGIDLDVGAGQVVAVMGPNGSGKSTLGHLLMGRPGYRATAGSATIGGEDLMAMSTCERARHGLFLAHQHPVEVPGVPLDRALRAALSDRFDRKHVDAAISAEANLLGLDKRFMRWQLNVDLSGGEKKRNEMLQLGVLRPRLAVLDEIDSGLDVDAMRVVAQRLVQATAEWGLSILVITHFSRLLTALPADTVHVLAHGRIVDSGGPEMAVQLEGSGYAQYA